MKFRFVLIVMILLVLAPVAAISFGQGTLAERFEAALSGQTAAHDRLTAAADADSAAAAQQVLTSAELASAENAVEGADSEVDAVRDQILEYLASLSNEALLAVIMCGIDGCPAAELTPASPVDDAAEVPATPVEEPTDPPAPSDDAQADDGDMDSGSEPDMNDEEEPADDAGDGG